MSVEDRISALEAELAELKARSVEAQEVRLVDDDGRVRGRLGMTDGCPTLAFSDEGGQVRARLVISPDGPGLTFTDEAGRTRAWLGFTKDALRIGFADANGRSRAFFGVMPSGPVIRLYDEDQKVVWAAGE